MINVGLIGCGRIADLHALGYKDNPDARIYAVCDTNPERAEARQAQWGAERAYTKYVDLLRNPDIDAVEILTPFETHERIAIDAFKAEKHVAVQKPMTTTLRSAQRMVLEAQAVGVIFKVTEIYLQYPPLVMAHKLIQEGAIGEPLNMRIKYICGPSGGWDVQPFTYEQQLQKARQGYGLETFDHGHHEWATAWRLLGDVERVSAWIDTTDGVLDCPATIMWKCRGTKRYGICDFVFASDMHIPTRYYPNDEWYEINGSRGILLVNRGTGNIKEGPAVSLFDGHCWKDFSDIPSDWSQGFIGATRNFIAAIKGEEEPLLTGQQGLDVLRFATAIQRSAKRRREVYLDEFDHLFPAWHSWSKRRHERKHVIVGRQPRRRRRLGRTSKYASQAIELTLKLPERFNPQAAKDWDCTLGLHLLPDGAAPEAQFALTIHQDQLTITQGQLPQDAILTLRMDAGVWAAILLGKKRLETAILQGKIKYEGRAEEGLKLRSAFKI